jgi:hypothetical protein
MRPTLGDDFRSDNQNYKNSYLNASNNEPRASPGKLLAYALQILFPMRFIILCLITAVSPSVFAKTLKLPTLFYEPSYQEIIFNKEISREFRGKYFETFGVADTDGLLYTRTNEFEQETQKRKLFAEYMVKRLTEWHTSNYLKSEPKLKPVLELKERLSHAEVHITPATQVIANYSFAGNFFDLVVLNPWAETKFSLEMNPRAFGPGAVQETKLVVQKDIEKNYRLRTTYEQFKGLALVEVVRNWPIWTTTFGASNKWRVTETPSESKFLVSFVRGY